MRDKIIIGVTVLVATAIMGWMTAQFVKSEVQAAYDMASEKMQDLSLRLDESENARIELEAYVEDLEVELDYIINGSK